MKTPMRKKDKAQQIQKILDDLYPEPLIPLKHKDTYTLLIAVLLSGQCTDARVNSVTPFLFERADNPYDMVKLSIEEIEEIIHSCGLAPGKARAIWTLSKQLIEKHGGKVPNTFDELEALPGVGHKTASVVMIQGFGIPAFPVDTHIHRCAQRWGLSSGKSVQQTEKDLKSLFPQDQWAKLHLQIIHFARTHCPARQHDPHACLICSWVSQQSRRH